MSFILLREVPRWHRPLLIANQGRQPLLASCSAPIERRVLATQRPQSSRFPLPGVYLVSDTPLQVGDLE